MFDSNFLLPSFKVCQLLYNKQLFDPDVCGTDFTNAFVNIDIDKQIQHSYLSPAHDLFLHKGKYQPRLAFFRGQGVPCTNLKTVKTQCGVFDGKGFLSEHANLWMIDHDKL